jgi:hypothetical protein
MVQALDVSEAMGVLAAVSTIEHASHFLRLSRETSAAASALRVRSERRVGVLIREGRERGELAKYGQNKRFRSPVSACYRTLSDLGIDRNQALRYVKLAEADEGTFEQAVETVSKKAAVTGRPVGLTTVLHEIDPAKAKPKPKVTDRNPLLKKTRRHNANKIIDNVITQLAGLVSALELVSIEDVDPARKAEWAGSFEESMSALRKHMRPLLKEPTQ